MPNSQVSLLFRLESFPKASSKKNRYYHTCAEHAGHIWLGGGYRDATTEKYDVSSNTWTSGPDLPYINYYPGTLITSSNSLIYTGGKYNKNIYQLNSAQNGWIQVSTNVHICLKPYTLCQIGEMAQRRYAFPALTMSENTCRGEHFYQLYSVLLILYHSQGSRRHLKIVSIAGKGKGKWLRLMSQ